MSSPVNYNVNRNYRFSFFRVIGDGDKTPFSVLPLADYIQNSVNFSFDYSVVSQTQNSAKFTFWNLSPQTISLFATDRNRIGFSLDIWYGNGSGTQSSTIFKGLVFTTNTYLQGPNLITEVVGCDVFVNLEYKRIAQGFPPGTSALTMVQYFIRYYGEIISLSSESYSYLTKVYTINKFFRGTITDILNRIAADCGVIFAWHNNTFYFVPNNVNLPRIGTGQVINAKNGLVGNVKASMMSTQLFPVNYFTAVNLDRNAPLLSVTTLIRPYTIYSSVRLQSEQFNGDYGILHFTQQGEWRGTNWYSHLTLFPILS